jgi:hypothetical protein
MSDFIITFLVTSLLLFAALVVTAYVIVRVLFVRIAERISVEIAPRLDSAAAGLSRGAASRPGFARAARAGVAVGRKIRDLAVAQGLDGDDAKRVFLARLDRTERLMDRQISLPVVGGIGLDALLGLIPYVGDTASALVTGSLILNSLQYGLPRSLVAKMVANMFVDLLFGSIPIVGDMFDVAFKANTRNIALLRAHLEREKS